MTKLLREKIIEILRANPIDRPRTELQLCELQADQILSLIIESLPEKDKRTYQESDSEGTDGEIIGYNAYREELIKMLNGV